MKLINWLKFPKGIQKNVSGFVQKRVLLQSNFFSFSSRSIGDFLQSRPTLFKLLRRTAGWLGKQLCSHVLSHWSHCKISWYLLHSIFVMTYLVKDLTTHRFSYLLTCLGILENSSYQFQNSKARTLEVECLEEYHDQPRGGPSFEVCTVPNWCVMG